MEFNPEYKVGGIVKIKDDLLLGERYSTYEVTIGSLQCAGKEVMIRTIGGFQDKGFIGIPVAFLDKGEPSFVFGYDAIDWDYFKIDINPSTLLDFLNT